MKQWLLCSILTFGLCSQADAAQWPTTKFTVIDETAEGLFSDGKLTQQEASEVKKAAQVTAEYYQTLGFPPPLLERDGSDGPYKIRIQDDGGTSGYIRACTDSLLAIAAGNERIYLQHQIGGSSGLLYGAGSSNGGKLTFQAAETIAHELFHAVQSASPFYRHAENICSVGGWIDEGSADAIGRHVAELITGRRPTLLDPDGYLNRRSYDQTLAQEKKSGINKLPRALRYADASYRTASFWLWLSELYGHGQGQLPALTYPQVNERDFRYLQKLLEIEGSASSSLAELQWLEIAIRRVFKRSIRQIYGEFVTSFATYRSERTDVNENGQWRASVFGTCSKVRLEPENPVAYVTLDFELLAARCIEIELTQDQPVELVIIGRASSGRDTIAGLAGIVVGVPGIEYIAQSTLWVPGANVDTKLPENIPGPQSSQAGTDGLIGVWRPKYDPAKDEAIIISRTPDLDFEQPPAKQTIEFAISHPGWNSSITPEEEATTPTNLNRNTDPGADGDGSVPVNHQAQPFSTNVMSAAHIGRFPDDPVCADAFLWRSCGPRSRITLRLSPGSISDLGATSGRGGFLAQMTGVLESSTDSMLDGGMAQWAAMEKETPGSQILIDIPLVDYGFTGSFSNAYIAVQMPEGQVLEAKGPTDAIAGQGTRFPVSGQVTIEEYSQDVMRGSFSAALIDQEDYDSTSSNLQQTLPIRHQLSGQFTIAGPVLTDRRSRLVNPGAYQDTSADLNTRFPGLTDVVDGGVPGQNTMGGASGNNRSAGAANASLCDCSCNFQADASSVCANACEPVYLACSGEPAEIDAPKSQADINGEQQEIARLRARLIEVSMERFGEAGTQQVITTFDSVPNTMAAKRLATFMFFPELREEFDQDH